MPTNPALDKILDEPRIGYVKEHGSLPADRKAAVEMSEHWHHHQDASGGDRPRRA